MESYRNMFEVGDIVWWSEWETLENYQYTSKICYQKSKYEIIYYINFEEELFKLNNTTNNDISVITSPKNEIVKEKND